MFKSQLSSIYINLGMYIVGKLVEIARRLLVVWCEQELIDVLYDDSTGCREAGNYDVSHRS